MYILEVNKKMHVIKLWQNQSGKHVPVYKPALLETLVHFFKNYLFL